MLKQRIMDVRKACATNHWLGQDDAYLKGLQDIFEPHPNDGTTIGLIDCQEEGLEDGYPVSNNIQLVYASKGMFSMIQSSSLLERGGQISCEEVLHDLAGSSTTMAFGHNRFSLRFLLPGILESCHHQFQYYLHSL